MRLFQRLFYQPKHTDNTVKSDGLWHILAPSVIGILICAVYLCGISWAWFTSTASTGTAAITTPNYNLAYQVDSGSEVAIADNGTTSYTMTGESCAIKIKATGTEGATGYCKIQIGESCYYTGQIATSGEFSFNVSAASGTTITFIPMWGTYSGTDAISSGHTINAGNTQSNDSNAEAGSTSGTNGTDANSTSQATSGDSPQSESGSTGGSETSSSTPSSGNTEGSSNETTE